MVDIKRLIAMGALGKATPWYLPSGLSISNIAGVWKSVGVASLAASYLRIAGDSGNANIDPAVVGGTAPDWTSDKGWYSSNAMKYLDTGIIPANNYSMFCLFDCTSLGTDQCVVCGVNDTNNRFSLTPRRSSSGDDYYYSYGNAHLITGSRLDGIHVMGISGADCYLDGSYEGNTNGGNTAPTHSILIMTRSEDGTVILGTSAGAFVGYVMAICIYKTKLTTSQSVALTTNMLNLSNLQGQTFLYNSSIGV